MYMRKLQLPIAKYYLQISGRDMNSKLGILFDELSWSMALVT